MTILGVYGIDEAWIPVPEYEGLYEVSSWGRVRSLDRRATDGRRYAGKILKQSTQKRYGENVGQSEYRVVGLRREGVQTVHRVHNVVLLAFTGERPEGMQALHRDDDPSNNRVWNLRWGTSSENMLDAVRNGKYRSANAEKTHCKRGHALEGANLFIRKHDGARICVTCKNMHSRNLYAAKRPQSED